MTEPDMTMSQPSARPKSPRRRRLILIIGGVILLGGLGYGAYLVHYWQRHVSTDDAYVEGIISPISARIPGKVVQVLINDNQNVKKGDLLVRLDPKDYEVALRQAQAAVDTAKANLQNAQANFTLTDQTTRSEINQADASLAVAASSVDVAAYNLEQQKSELAAQNAAVAAAEAAVTAAEANYDLTRVDRDRYKNLLAKQFVSLQSYDQAEAAFKNAQANLNATRQRLAQARAEARQEEDGVRSKTAAVLQARSQEQQAKAVLQNTRVQRRQVQVRKTQVEAARSQLSQAIANLNMAKLNVEYTDIRAPLDGRVTKKSVQVGQVVQAGQALFALVDLQDIWVVANFKETQLTNVRPGQPATISVDTYPDVVFKGHVDSIQAGSGAVFSLLPPENATGNFVKVVQRIPVKIDFQPGENSRHLLVPGMSVVPTITTR